VRDARFPSVLDGDSTMKSTSVMTWKNFTAFALKT
jgi:hypothetical protein